MEITENKIRQMIYVAAEQGAKHALVGAGLNKSEVKKAEAYRRYGRIWVDRWIKEGKIIPVQRGARALLNLLELEVLAKTHELIKNHLNDIH